MPQDELGVFDSAIRAANRTVRRLTGAYIDGVEVTQAIQYRDAAAHLTDAADRGPDNSIMLAADKPAYVRVYVRAGLWDTAGVTAAVTVERPRRGVWEVDAPLQQQPAGATITAQSNPDYDTVRSSLARSLNFLIPASAMRGRFRLRVVVSVPGGRPGDEVEVVCVATLLQRLRIRGIPVRYDGPDASGNQVQLGAPTLANFQSTAAWALNAWPVSRTPDITLAGTFTLTWPLTGNIVNGKCPSSWNNLLCWLKVARWLDGNRDDAHYYALLPNGIPIGNAGGCGGGPVGAGFNGGGQTLAHELGHMFEFDHAPCGLVTGDPGDASYPAYEPYDTAGAGRRASIGEFGLDVTAGQVMSPRWTRDFMSYCGNLWISVHRYQQLLESPALFEGWLAGGLEHDPPIPPEYLMDPRPPRLPPPPDPPPWFQPRPVVSPDPEPVFVVVGHLRDGHLDVRGVLRIEARPTSTGRRVPSTDVELLDERGDVIGRGPLRAISPSASCGCRCGGDQGEEPRHQLVEAVLSDPGRGAALRLVRDGEEVWSRLAPEDPPVIKGVEVELDGDRLRMRWEAVASDAFEVHRAVRWSADDGRTWEMLAIIADADELEAPVELMTSGPAQLQVLVSDGFNTSASEPVAIDVPARDPVAAIMWPQDGGTVTVSRLLRMSGIGTASDGHVLPPSALSWELDGVSMGQGTDVWVPGPDWDGEHRCTLVVRDGQRESRTSVVFNSTTGGHPPTRTHDD